MNARDEQRSLHDCPLPKTLIINPLTRVWDIDGQIKLLQDQIADLMQQRKEALDYAIAEQIAEDENCRLEISLSTPKRTVDLALLRAKYKKAWGKIWKSKKQEAQDAVDLFGNKPDECKAEFTVNQAEVKKAMKAEGAVVDAVLHRVGETTANYKVIKK